MSSKDELLKKHDDELKKEHNLSFKALITSYIALLLILCITVPKVYISNEIYYTSRDISELKNKLNVLLEENKSLKARLERIRYRNQIINNMRY